MNVTAAVLTCQLVIGCVALAVPAGCSVAIAICHLAAWRRAAWFFSLAMIAACVLPLYLHAAAWESAAGKFGILRWTQSAAASQPLSGMSAAIWIHGLSGAAWVAVATGFGLSRLPRQLIESAYLDQGPLRRWTKVFLPAITPWIAAGALWVATLAATEMTVVDLYGVRTIADEFYLLYAAQPSNRAIVQTLLPSLPIGIALAVILRRIDGLSGTSCHGASSHDATEGGFDKWSCIASGSRLPQIASAFWATALTLLLLAVPVASLFATAGRVVEITQSASGETLVNRFWQWDRCVRTVRSGWGTFLPEHQWTLTIGFSMGIFASAVALAVVSRCDTKRQRFACDMIGLVAVMIPGPIVALAIVWLFRRDLPMLDTLYQQTLGPTFLALLPRSGAAAYIVIRTATARLDPAIGAAAMLDTDRPWRRYFRIDLPRLAPAILVSIGTAAAVAVADVPATLPVVPPGVSTVGTRLFGLLHSGSRSQEAGLAIAFLSVVMVVAMIGRVLHVILKRRYP